ncbi:MAG: glutamyl-tRNA reductase, partial [Cellulosimicrobium sp.]|nr:glutamyl-tRNA reductase [Cellulosimicrobium sp.]
EQAIEHVLDAAAVVRARERAAVRAGDEPAARPTVVLDLALHRDVDPRVADVEGVLLYDLATLAAHSPSIASELVVQARAIVDDATRAFEETRLGRAADTAVVALLADAERRIALEVADVVGLREADGDPVEPDEADEIPAPRDRRGARRGRRGRAGGGTRGRRGRAGARRRSVGHRTAAEPGVAPRARRALTSHLRFGALRPLRRTESFAGACN